MHGAALRLVAERGFEDVTIEDIAAAADVSPRTFFNYFGSKEDVIVNPDPDRVERLRALLASHTSADEQPLEVIESVLLASLDELTDRREEWLLRLRLVREIPALTPRHLAAYDAMERALIDDVVRRTGTDSRPTSIRCSSAARRCPRCAPPSRGGAPGTASRRCPT